MITEIYNSLKRPPYSFIKFNLFFNWNLLINFNLSKNYKINQNEKEIS